MERKLKGIADPMDATVTPGYRVDSYPRREAINILPGRKSPDSVSSLLIYH